MHEIYIKTQFLKKDEMIEKKQYEGQLLVLTVAKKTARTYRRVAQFKVTANPISQLQIPDAINKYQFTPKAKRQLIETNEILQSWLNEGWIVREIRYNPDGISVSEENYRMGPAYLKAIEQQKIQLDENREAQMKLLHEKAEQLNLPPVLHEAINWTSLPEKWSHKKKMKYIEFCLAFYELSEQKDLFDYKEIGANLYDKIGGSKYFDTEREVFLEQLEQSGIDASVYGLVSIGKIVPIYFTGNVRNEYSSYSLGTVHATTDNAVMISPFSTTNTNLWLVENRAILTRMAVETEFLQQSNSCIVCLDGQIRSAHKAFIEQLLNSNIQQTIIWADTDAAGITIAKHAAEIVGESFKIVGRHFKLYDSVAKYASAHEQQAHEQEQQLGGVAEWKRWV